MRRPLRKRIKWIVEKRYSISAVDNSHLEENAENMGRDSGAKSG
jgi:hypothetical protein